MEGERIIGFLDYSLIFFVFAKHTLYFFVYMLERNYQAGLVKRIKRRFPGSVVLKNDANYLQGFPDLLILYNDRWAALEIKKSENASHRPNQDFYIDKLRHMSYAAFICPENERSVLDEVQRALEPDWPARISERQ